jgi:hypothetical protein
MNTFEEESLAKLSHITNLVIVYEARDNEPPYVTEPSKMLLSARFRVFFDDMEIQTK